MVSQQTLTVATRGRGTYEITREIAAIVRNSGVTVGLSHVFIHHTSASLIVTENADPTVRYDLDAFMGNLVADGDSNYRHNLEGDDDMSAHIRSILTQTELTIPVRHGELMLGTWQGIFVWEHRYEHFDRELTVTTMGE